MKSCHKSTGYAVFFRKKKTICGEKIRMDTLAQSLSTATYADGNEKLDPGMASSDRRRAFRELHQAGCFVVPNPWDVGSTRYL